MVNLIGNTNESLTWDQIKTKISNAQEFLDKVKKFTVSEISEENFKALELDEFLSLKKYRKEKIVKLSRACGAFVEWLLIVNIYLKKEFEKKEEEDPEDEEEEDNDEEEEVETIPMKHEDEDYVHL